MGLVPHDDAQALLAGPVKGVAAVERPANADLRGMLRQDEAFFQRPVKGSAVVVGLAVIAGYGVAVRVKVQQGHWSMRRMHGAQVCQADAVVAAQNDGQGFGGEKRLQAAGDGGKAVFHVAGYGVDVAVVGNGEALVHVHIKLGRVWLEQG